MLASSVKKYLHKQIQFPTLYKLYVCFTVVPCDSVSIKLQELEQLMGFFSVSCFLLRCQGVVGHQQRVGSSSCTE